MVLPSIVAFGNSIIHYWPILSSRLFCLKQLLFSNSKFLILIPSGPGGILLSYTFEIRVFALVHVSVSLNRERNSIVKHLIRAKNNLHSGHPNVSPVITDLESQLSSLVSKQSEGAKIRSRAQWFEESEKPTRYFFRLEQKRAESNKLGSVFDVNGIEKNLQSDLEDVLVQFYSTLFSKDILDLQIQTEIIAYNCHLMIMNVSLVRVFVH